MRRVALAALLIAVALPSVLDAQKRCRKGIPCGNSCISASKTCRIGSSYEPPAERRREPVATPREAATLFGDVKRGYSRRDAPKNWVASVDGAVYYRKGCAIAKKLHRDEVVYFEAESQAQAAGFRRSRAIGC